MIAHLQGKLLRRAPGVVVIDVNGVGYLVSCREATAAGVQPGDPISLRVHTVVRDDALELFGFESELEERLFHELIRVPGVGPRLAMNALGGGEPEELVRAIVSGDHARLRKLPGVGKKIAERLVLDLKDRLATFAPPPSAVPTVGTVPAEVEEDELLAALAALGYKPAEAERLAEAARNRVAEGASIQELLKEALRAR